MNLKNRILKKSNLWHVGAIALFVIIACAYFSPALKGYAVKQGDIVNFVGMSREIVDYTDNNEEQIHWTNALFSGMPSTQLTMQYEGTWLAKSLTAIVSLGLPRPILFMFVYFFGFYILALSLRIKPFIGILGSIAFGFSSYFIVIIEAGHTSKAAAIGLAPLMIAGFIMAYRFKNWVLGAGLASLFFMVELAANHVQITYYMAFVLLLIGIAEFVRYLKENKLLQFTKVTGVLLLGYVFAILINYGNLFGTVEYSKQTIRGGSELTILPNGEENAEIKTTGLDRDYVTTWSYGRGETFSFFVPNFKGGETQAIGQATNGEELMSETRDRIAENLKNNPDYSQNAGQFAADFTNAIGGSNHYWGNQPFTSGPVYIGIIVLFLAFLGMVYVKDKIKWALLSITLLTIMLAWGKNYVSAFVLVPILLYNVNLFLDGKKLLIFTGINSAILFLAITSGDLFVQSSLTDFFLDYVPGYNKLRAVTIILVVAELCAPLLGILFLQQLIKNKAEIVKESMGLIVVSSLFFLILLVMSMSPSAFNSFLSEQELADLATITDVDTLAQYTLFYDELQNTRMDIFRADVLRSLGFLVVAIGLVFAFVYAKFSKYLLTGGLALFILLDLVLVDQRYLNNEETRGNYNQWVEKYQMIYPFAAGNGERQILAIESQEHPELAVKIDSALTVLEAEMKTESDVSNREKQVRRDFITFRIMNRYTNFRVYEEGNPFNSSYASYFNKSIGGYHGAKLSRYQDLIDFHISKGNPGVLNMLNTKYYLRPQRDQTGVVNTELTHVNGQAMGNAWFAKDIQLVADANEEIMAMDSYNITRLAVKGDAQVFVNGQAVTKAELKGDETIAILLPGMEEAMPIDNIPYSAVTTQALALNADPSGVNWIYDSAPDSMVNKIFSLTTGPKGGWVPTQTTLVDQRYAANVTEASYSGNGTIEMVSYHPDRMVYASNSTDKQFAVFSEMYYENGWKAYIDNNEVPVVRANYVLRAIEVPAGVHEIRFEFELETYEKAKTMALVGTIALLLLLAYGIFVESKREETQVIDSDNAKGNNA